MWAFFIAWSSSLYGLVLYAVYAHCGCCVRVWQNNIPELIGKQVLKKGKI
jgi:hypothetical protein